MNEKVLHVLEYDKIVDKLSTFATSEPGKRMCRELLPSSDLREIDRNLKKTDAAIARIFKKGSVSFGSNRELSGYLKALKIGSSLDAPQLLNIAGFLDNVNRVKSYGRADKEEDTRDVLSDMFDGLEPLTPVAAEIRRCIISEDEISSDASSTLRSIRRDITLTGERIHAQLNKMVTGSYRSYLQEPVVTMRGDRYCIPVKAEYKGQVSGIVHDQSSSGSTLFIEPSIIVEMNNKLRELAGLEKAEIDVILARLSSEAADYLTALSDDAKLMTELDFIFAKASLALDQEAITPIFNEEHYFNIIKGRHPLLDKKKAVPIDVYAGKDFDMIIITGPNTGGKTVTLKTVGLLTLMGQAGLAIPAADRSELSVFEEIYADIGDEQSIEQSLSTFSSHMTNTVSILENADENSLCLFDELGAGTDPTEGAALAISILNHLHERGIRTLATTHYSELKVYALTTEGIQNASCEFDVESLRPTYRLLIGIPGKSNAFAISKRLGLSQEIIDAAGEQISQDNRKFEDLLTDLENSRVTIENERLEIERYKEEVEKLKEELKSKQNRLDESRDKILRKANEEARQILQEAKDTADETIRTVRKAQAGIPIQELEKARQNVGAKISDKNSKLSIKNKPQSGAHKALKPSQIKLGDSVRIISMGLKGTISSKPDKDGNLVVQCGIMKSRANIDDLELIKEEGGKEQMKKFYGKYKMDLSGAKNIGTELNLIGMNSADAIAELDKYLDSAYVSHLSSVRIVHGKGSGILRQAVHEHLKAAPYVKSFKLGEFGEGDSGVTVVTFIK
jgi:DNA mismatch repair protein MutS2